MNKNEAKGIVNEILDTMIGEFVDKVDKYMDNKELMADIASTLSECLVVAENEIVNELVQ